MDFWATGDYGNVPDLSGGMGTALAEAAGVEPGLPVLDVAVRPGGWRYDCLRVVGTIDG